jgi:hypothetical protein
MRARLAFSDRKHLRSRVDLCCMCAGIVGKVEKARSNTRLNWVEDNHMTGFGTTYRHHRWHVWITSWLHVVVMILGTDEDEL